MYTLNSTNQSLRASIRDETEFLGEFGIGKRGNVVKRVQEWLSFHGHDLVIDSDFGPVTELNVRRVQTEPALPPTGRVDAATHAALIQPMVDVLQAPQTGGLSFQAATLFHVKKHQAAGAIEIGGQNKGPWVRLYMDGRDGADQPWCAGFVRFILRQASETSGYPRPINGHVNCDRLGDQAKAEGFYVTEGELDKSLLTPGSIFLSRASDGDLYHTGIVTQVGGSNFQTIEGNTDESGSPNGYRVFTRTRGYENYDFIIFTGHDAAQIAAPQDLSLTANVDVRRYFFDDDTVNTYGTFYAHWGGWITAAHVVRDIKFTTPPFASGDLTYQPDGLDAALVGCRLPVAEPEQLREGMPIKVIGFPAGSPVPAIREGAVHYTVPGSAKWIIRIDSPHEPVVSGMSGGVAINRETGKPIGIIIEANHKANLDPDPELDHSLNIVSLCDVWNAAKNVS
jgi:hypothetical protein